MSFEAFPKIARLNRDCIITEKIDGTNAQVEIVSASDATVLDPKCIATQGELVMFAGSRTRYITPKDDNFGFAAWVEANAAELFKLGEGRHYGEWWGGKVQRGYGITDKRFSLFNTSRWNLADMPAACCGVVPTLYNGPFSTEIVSAQIDRLRAHGSLASPGFMRPEGIVVFLAANRTMFKVTVDDDAEGKEQKARREKFVAA